MTLRKYNTDELCLFDDVFFSACFDGHPECTAELLKVILGMPDIRIIEHAVQKIKVLFIDNRFQNDYQTQ